jgi:hypothetical protein
MSLRPKTECEICKNKDKKILHRHHIIPRCDKRSTNKDDNLAILCPNCHSLVHSGDFIIIGVYYTTGGKELFWFKKGEEPPIKEKFWVIKENSKVVMKKERQK